MKHKWGDLVVILVLLVGAPVYYYAQHKGYADGYNAGINEQKATDQTTIDTIDGGVNDLINKYDQLSATYNSLRDAVVQYVGETQYQAAPSIHCTSNNFDTGTSFTNCY